MYWRQTRSQSPGNKNVAAPVSTECVFRTAVAACLGTVAAGACGEEPGLQLDHLRAIAINHH